MKILFIGLGGFLGAVLRYVVFGDTSGGSPGCQG